MATSGTDTMTTSPNRAASAGVPAEAPLPSFVTSDFNSSGWRDAKRTSCPASIQSFPTVAPIIPAPMIPIFIFIEQSVVELAPGSVRDDEQQWCDHCHRADGDDFGVIERHVLEHAYGKRHRGDAGKQAAEHAAEPVEQHIHERPDRHLVRLPRRTEVAAVRWSNDESNHDDTSYRNELAIYLQI